MTKEQEEAIEIYLKMLNNVMNNFEDKLCEDMQDVVREVKNHIQQLETKVSQLGKGQQSLIQSRRKWKKRYYKERTKVKELEEREQKVKEFLEKGIERRHWEYYDGVSHTQYELDKQAKEILNLYKEGEKE